MRVASLYIFERKSEGEREREAEIGNRFTIDSMWGTMKNQ